MLIEHCRARAAAFKCTRSMVLRHEPLPLSGVNKVNKALLRNPIGRGATAGSARSDADFERTCGAPCAPVVGAPMLARTGCDR